MADQITDSVSTITIHDDQDEESEEEDDNEVDEEAEEAEDESDYEGLVRHNATCDECEKVRFSHIVVVMGLSADTQSPSTAFVTNA